MERFVVCGRFALSSRLVKNSSMNFACRVCSKPIPKPAQPTQPEVKGTG